MAADTPAEVVRYASEVASALSAVRADLVGVYVHGSAALGGFRAARSDVDVLAVVGGPADRSGQLAMGEAVVATAAQCPGTGLEMSVITAATAARCGACPFEVHIRTGATGTVVVPGADHGADPDLLLHCAVCREHGLTVYGPPAAGVFGPVPAARVRAAMADELAWGLEHGDATYAVLNACRALRFATDGQLCSKVDGARWYTARHGESAVVTAALTHQLHGHSAPALPDAETFVMSLKSGEFRLS
ncbi:aminoglycoside adenylyltransferase domain-containing protein [Actinacidiphila sp. bgisy144]|uniref:aminoglycoside adenylyltransferase domain-containing protein n=1 Tax=Actinacidiphila sp. bgisy144 TaxID=3413791 RepID=UPI003EB9A87F